MAFAVEIQSDDHDAALQVLARARPWHQPPGRRYETAEATNVDHPLLKGCRRAFFIKMAPGTYVHKHRDPREVVDFYDTDHIVVTTNEHAFICWEDEPGVQKSQHLDLGKRYRIVDRGLMHWAVNDGDTDRIHLLIEYPKK